MNNKKGLLGSELLLWFFRFFMILFIAMIIVYAVYYFYSAQYDIRELEAKSIAKKITECVMKEGVLEHAAFAGAAAQCVQLDAGEYFINLSIEGTSGKEYSLFGKQDLQVLCSIDARVKYGPYCLTQKYYVLLDDGTKRRGTYLEMIIAIGKVEKNV